MAIGLRSVALVAFALLTACGRYPTAQSMQVRSDELARDLATIDQVAIDSGFTVSEQNYQTTYNNRQLVFLRSYQNPTRCCLRMGLAKQESEPILEFWVSDSYAIGGEFRPPECAMYGRFREALIAKLGAARVVQDKLFC